MVNHSKYGWRKSHSQHKCIRWYLYLLFSMVHNDIYWCKIFWLYFCHFLIYFYHDRKMVFWLFYLLFWWISPLWKILGNHSIEFHSRKLLFFTAILLAFSAYPMGPITLIFCLSLKSSDTFGIYLRVFILFGKSYLHIAFWSHQSIHERKLKRCFL